MTQYIAVNDATCCVLYGVGISDPDGFTGPVTPPPDPVEGVSFYAWQGKLDFSSAPTPTCTLQWENGAPAWIETASLDDRKNAAIAKCYTDIDAIYADAVGNRTEEYKDAESDARAFKDAGYTGTVSDYVHDYALNNPTGTAQTDQWAADQIISRANAFAQAKLSMRSQRFSSQAALRAAAVNADVDAAVSDWNNFIDTTRANLGLPAIQR